MIIWNSREIFINEFPFINIFSSRCFHKARHGTLWSWIYENSVFTEIWLQVKFGWTGDRDDTERCWRPAATRYGQSSWQADVHQSSLAGWFCWCFPSWGMLSNLILKSNLKKKNLKLNWTKCFFVKITENARGLGCWVLDVAEVQPAQLFRSVLPRKCFFIFSKTESDLQHKALGQALFDEVCRHLNLLECDYFSLEFTDCYGNRVCLIWLFIFFRNWSGLIISQIKSFTFII